MLRWNVLLKQAASIKHEEKRKHIKPSRQIINNFSFSREKTSNYLQEPAKIHILVHAVSFDAIINQRRKNFAVEILLPMFTNNEHKEDHQG